MGFYVNPPNEEKEAFLAREGIPVPLEWSWADVPPGFLPVVLVHNGTFTAAGIAESARDLEARTSRDDPRPRVVFLVPIAKLIGVTGRDFARCVEQERLC